MSSVSCSIFITTISPVSPITSSLRCSRRCWKSGRGGNWVRTLMRSTATHTAKRHTLKAAVSPLAMCPTPVTQMLTGLTSTKPTAARFAPLQLRRTANSLSPLATGQGNADLPKAGTPCTSLCNRTEAPPAALPQRMCVWKSAWSTAHILWKERKLMSDFPGTSSQKLSLIALLALDPCLSCGSCIAWAGRGWGSNKQGSWCSLIQNIAGNARVLPSCIWVFIASGRWRKKHLLTSDIRNDQINQNFTGVQCAYVCLPVHIWRTAISTLLTSYPV